MSLRTQVAAPAANWSTSVQGTGADLPIIRDWAVDLGAFFDVADVSRGRRSPSSAPWSAISCSAPGADPIGETIRINNQPFKVIGVLARKGQGPMGQDQDDTVMLPYTTVQKRMLGITHVSNLTISAPMACPFGGVRRGRRSAARASPHRRRLSPTTSRSGRSRRWPAS